MFVKVSLRIPKVSRLVGSARPTKSNFSSIHGKQSTYQVQTNKLLISNNIRFFTADTQATVPPPTPPPVEAKTSKEEQQKNDQKEQQNESQQKTNTEKEQPKTMDFREFKRVLNSKPPRYMGLWYIIGPVILAIASMYYYNEADQQERKVDKALKMIRSVDSETRKAGLDALEDCLYLREHLFATVTDVPQSFDLLLKEGCLDALLQALSNGDSETKQKSLIWLVRLSSIPDARKYISQHFANSLVPIIGKGDGSPVWVIAASLLVRLTSYADSAHSVAAPKLVELLEKNLDGTHHPVSALLSAHVLASLLERQENLNLTIPGDQIASLTNNPNSQSAISAVLKNAVPSRPDHESHYVFKYLDHLKYAAGFGIFGYIYGLFRWGRKIKREASMYNVAVDKARLKKFIATRSRVGRYVFFLLSLDILAELAMNFPSRGVHIQSPWFADQAIHLQLPEKLYGLPKTTYLAIGEATLFTATALLATRTQRYVVFPLLLASYTAHQEEIRQVTGVDLVDLVPTITDFVKVNYEKLK